MTSIPDMNQASVDADIPWHYGDPFAEQRLLAAGHGRVDLSNRGVVRISGADRLSWLNSLTTQDFTLPFTSTQALILSPQGHIEHDMHVVDDDTNTWLIVDAGCAQALVTYLNRMKFMLDVVIDNVSDEFAVIGAPEWVNEGVVSWTSSVTFAMTEVDDKYVPHRPAAWQVSEIITPREHKEDILEAHSRVGSWAWEAHRIRAGVPRMRLDIDGRTIPHEVGLLASAVSMTKGCYRGQETVSKVFYLGKPPRRIVQLSLDGSPNVVPPSGTAVFHGDIEVGVLTSSVQDYEEGPIALAIIKRSVPVDAPLVVAGVAATQTVIVQA